MQDEHAQPPQEQALVGSASEPGPLMPPDLRGKLSLGLIALGCVMLMVVVFRMLWRRPRARSRAAPEAAGSARAAPAAQRSQDRLDQLMCDAEELTRRLAAILDNKAARLEVLIGQADERMRSLEAATSARRPGSQQAPERERAVEPEPRDAVDPFHRKVYDLADQGLTPVDIARRIDRPTGQVELILALRRA